MEMRSVKRKSKLHILWDGEGGLWVMSEVLGEGLRHSHNIVGNVAE
jgi:hypothetical protein